MVSTSSGQSVRERIMAAAFDLFYQQGYRGTGINQIIAVSGVAKASFYDHFPAKADLLHAYARELSRCEMEDIRSEIDQASTPRERFFRPLQLLLPWFESSQYRGCPFQNMIAEIEDDPEIELIVQQHHEKLRELIESLLRDLVRDEPDLEPLDCSRLTRLYQVLMNGAIATAVAYRESWPVEVAIETIEHELER